jgi:hypothetical protein
MDDSFYRHILSKTPPGRRSRKAWFSISSQDGLSASETHQRFTAMGFADGSTHPTRLNRDSPMNPKPAELWLPTQSRSRTALWLIPVASRVDRAMPRPWRPSFCPLTPRMPRPSPVAFKPSGFPFSRAVLRHVPHQADQCAADLGRMAEAVAPTAYRFSAPRPL